MNDATSPMVYLTDYRAPDWIVESLALDFLLAADLTRVTARMQVQRVPNVAADSPLRLYGRDLSRERLEVDGRTLTPADYTEDEAGLLLHGLPERAEILITTQVCPQSNTALEGLFVSGGTLCTQCEPEGFRRITYFPDRPDVLTRYRVRLEADVAAYPVLLANGNRIESGSLPEGRHYAVWEDPFPKPSYLFALVAGNLVCESAEFVTVSGRPVQLEVYVEPHNRDRCGHALASLAKAMRYDEEAFGREYDLDVYMIVAVDDFNMGAMENKGLNLFNAKYVLASPQTATDQDYLNIESIIAHEYFHNWSGNRVTCRDWFQLSLKEGLTVFRDQEFTTDSTLFGVKRIDDVQRLRAFQFTEDAGPLAHPVRPQQYAAINNFYTMTVYEKGAEVIRMLRTLIGRDTFRRGLDRYFERFDGQAVTVDDLLAVMAEVSGRDLAQFQRWYSQAGTPRVRVATEFDAESGTLRITAQQSTPPTAEQAEPAEQGEKLPLLIPIRMALLDADGHAMTARMEGQVSAREWVLELSAAEQSFTLYGLTKAPAAISWLRGFTAPILLDTGQTADELAHLLAHDDDAFVRWDAAQTLFTRAVRARVETGPDTELENRLTQAMEALLSDTRTEPVLLAALLELPSHRELLEGFAQADPIYINEVRQAVEHAVFNPLCAQLRNGQPALADVDNNLFDAAAMGLRRLRNRVLALCVALEIKGAMTDAAIQFREAANQTLRMGALFALNDQAHPLRNELMAEFEREARDDPLRLDKWFALEAASLIPGGLARVEQLTQHEGFRWSNPNRVRAVLGPFMAQNHIHFHLHDGAGYRYIAQCLDRLDSINPQTAAALARPLTRWRRLDVQRRSKMRAALESLAVREGLSRELGDVVKRGLAKMADDPPGSMPGFYAGAGSEPNPDPAPDAA